MKVFEVTLLDLPSGNKLKRIVTHLSAGRVKNMFNANFPAQQVLDVRELDNINQPEMTDAKA